MNVERLLWDARGRRRIPSGPAFDAAVAKLPRGRLERICEHNPWGPIYLIPTRRFLRALAGHIRAVGAREVVEVAAGDGHLGRSLQRIAPDLRVRMTDSGAWQRPEARMNATERRTLRGVKGLRPGGDVLRLDALQAVRRFRPDLVLVSWLPPGPLLSRLVRSNVRYVLEIGAGSGITGDIRAWRYPHEFLEGPIERHGRCRLDERPAERLHTRATMYQGGSHPDFGR